MGLFKNIFGKGKKDENDKDELEKVEEAAEDTADPADEPDTDEPSPEPEVKKPALTAEDHAAIRRAVAAQMRGETPIEIAEREQEVINRLAPKNDTPKVPQAPQIQEKPDNEKLEQAKAKVKALAALKKQTDKFSGALKELGLALINCTTVYGAFDKDFKGSVPFITMDGRVELFSSLELAMKTAKHFEDTHHGHMQIKKLGIVNGVNQTDHFLRMCMHNGLFILRLDDGAKPMDMRIAELITYRSTGIVDDCGRSMRQLFIRQITYASRIANLDKEVKGTEFQVGLTQAMLTMRLNGYRELGNGLLYIFTGEDKEGTVFYTEEALKRAKHIIEVSKNKLGDKALVPKGLKRYEIYQGTFTPGATKINMGEGAESEMLCAFTDYEMAESLRKKAQAEGLNKAIAVVTYNELESFANQYEGMVIDLPSYSMVIPSKEFPNIRKCAASKTPISVQAKKKEDGSANGSTETDSDKPADGNTQAVSDHGTDNN